MKKTFKRAGVAVLSMAMLLSMGAVGSISASAYDTGKGGLEITAATGVGSATLKAYKVAEITGGHWNWVAAINSDMTNADLETVKTTNTAAAAKTVADKLANISNLDTKITPIAMTLGTENGTLEPGYYLVKATATSGSDTIIQPMIAQVNVGEKTTIANLKTTTIGIDKIITNVSKGAVVASTDNNKASVAEDGIVSYQLKTTFPIYADSVNSLSTHSFKLVDVYDPALTIQTSPAVEVYVDTDGTAGLSTTNDTKLALTTNYTYTNDASNHQFTITFVDDTVLDHNYRGKDVYVTFAAQFDTPATIPSNYDYDNTATVYFDNDYYASSADYTTDNDDADVYSVPLRVYKVDESNAAITSQDAQFQLTNSADNTETYTVTTNSSGYANFPSVAAGTYILTETQAPAGYKSITGEIARFEVSVSSAGVVAVRVSTDTGSNWTNMTPDGTTRYYTQTVQNEPTEGLPATGGMGTTLFTVGGAVIVLMAGFMFVLYMRKRKTEE